MKRLSAVLLAATGLFAAASASAAAPAAAASGEAVYNRWCVHCHATGRGNPGTESLQIKYGGKVPAALLERSDLAPAVVSTFVRQGVLSMPPFRKTEITDAELAALSAFVARKFSR
jgi:mono/diheme cytochrome c family protein